MQPSRKRHLTIRHWSPKPDSRMSWSYWRLASCHDLGGCWRIWSIIQNMPRRFPARLAPWNGSDTAEYADKSVVCALIGKPEAVVRSAPVALSGYAWSRCRTRSKLLSRLPSLRHSPRWGDSFNLTFRSGVPRRNVEPTWLYFGPLPWGSWELSSGFTQSLCRPPKSPWNLNDQLHYIVPAQ